MTEAIAAAAKALLKKLAVDLVLDKDKRNKFLLIVGSVVLGVIFLLMTPIVVLSSIGDIDPPQIDKSLFNEAAFIESLDNESKAKLVNLQNQGQAIEDAMTAVEVRNQTIKAQLIYLSFFDGAQNFNAQSYADLFKNSADDKALIDALNFAYGLEINYEEFMRTYIFVMNSTMNRYMFTDSKSKKYLTASQAVCTLPPKAVLIKCPTNREIFCPTALISEYISVVARWFSHRKILGM